MWIRNTSQCPDSEVRSLVRFASMLSDAHDVQVNVKNSRFVYAGRSYRRIPAIGRAHPRAQYLVVVRIGAPKVFPCTNEVTTIRWTMVEDDRPDSDSRLRVTKEGLRWNDARPAGIPLGAAARRSSPITIGAKRWLASLPMSFGTWINIASGNV